MQPLLPHSQNPWILISPSATQTSHPTPHKPIHRKLQKTERNKDTYFLLIPQALTLIIYSPLLERNAQTLNLPRRARGENQPHG